MENERRSTKRWDVSLKVVFEDSDQQQRQALASNISNKGIRLFSCADIGINDSMDLTVNLEPLGYIFVKAEACWKEANPNGTYVGFRFTQAKESERAKIFEYITRYHREQIKRAWYRGVERNLDHRPQTID